jgi:predicted dehydrogenase
VKANGEYDNPREASPWRYEPELSGGCAIIDAGIHIVDLLRFLTDQEIIQVSALVNTGPYPFPIDITSALSMGFANGAVGTINLSFVNKYPVSGFEISGSDGRLVGEETIGQRFSGTVTLITSSGSEIYHSEMANTYAAELEHFTQCIENDQEPMISGEEGMKDLKVCLAAYQSARDKRTIDIS